MTVADYCYSKQLISHDVYELLLQRDNLIDVDKTRCLLNNIRTVFSSKPSALKDFVSILSQVDNCKQIAEKIKKLINIHLLS